MAAMHIIVCMLALFTLSSACTEHCTCHNNNTYVTCYFPNATKFNADIKDLPSTVKELHLAGNLGNITSGIFNISNLLSLTCVKFWGYAQIDVVEAGAFEGLPELATLTFLHTSLTDIPSGILDGVGKLKEFHFIGHKNLTSLDSSVFDSGSCVGLIDLSQNSLENITDDTFKNTGSCLLTLNLDANDFKELRSSMFTGLDNLSTLSLASNRNLNSSSLTSSFEGMSNLTTLNIDFVPIGGAVTLKGLPSLRYISMKGARLKDLNVFGASMKRNLEVLDLSQNDFENTLDFSNFTAIRNLTIRHTTREQNLVFDQAKTLRRLDLQGTMMNYSTGYLFRGLDNLVYLNIRDTGLTTIPEGLFPAKSNLETLLLDVNNITHLADVAFATLGSMRELSLSHNMIQTIKDHVFDELANLELLKLDHNLLTSINVSSLQTLKNTTLMLDDNPWNCVCGLNSFRVWMETNNVTADVTCATPPEFKGAQLVTLTQDKLCRVIPPADIEYIDIGLYIGVAFVILFVMLFLTGGLIYFIQKRRTTLDISRERIP